MYNKKRISSRFGLWAGLMILLASSGCTWDSDSYDEYTNAVVGGEVCMYPISSIQRDGGKVVITCKRNSVGVCEREGIRVTGGDASDYEMSKHNFNYRTCPGGLKCYNVDAASGTEAYSYCASASCEEGEHAYSGTCEADDLMNCGKHDYVCANEVSQWLSGSCISGRCVAEACQEGYNAVDGICKSNCKTGEHYDSSTSLCVADDINNCGQTGHACSEEIKNSSVVRCVNGACEVETCADGYDKKDNACVSNCTTEQHYDSAEGRCVSNSTHDCGQTGYDCAQKVTNWSDGACEAGICHVTACSGGFKPASDQLSCLSDCGKDQHYDSQKGSCVADDINNCGQTGYVCKDHIKNSASVTCTNGTCIVTVCNSGYKVSNNACASNCNSNQYYDSSESLCKNNTLADCGQKGYSCADKINYWSDGTCTEGVCVVKACTSGYKVVNNMCMPSCSTNQYYSTTQATCLNSNVNNCGHEGFACSSLAGWASGDCVNSKCVAKSCTSSYTLDASTNSCVAKYQCGTNEHLYNGKCEEDDVDHCGSHTYACKDNVTGWVSGACLGGTCVVYECKSGYNYSQGKCEKQGPTVDCADDEYLSDGQCVKCNCNEDGALSQTCDESGVCSCKTGVTGNKCDKCDTGYTNCSGSQSVLKCLTPSASGWPANHSFNTFCAGDCSACKTGQTCNRSRKDGSIKCTGSINY